jgi:hypothetical protein
MLLAFPIAGLQPSLKQPSLLMVIAPFWAGLMAAPGYACIVISRWTAGATSPAERLWARTSLGLGTLACIGGLLMSGSLVVLFAGPCLLSTASVLYVLIHFERGW